MGRIHGVTVTLNERTETGRDAANEPIYTTTSVAVNDVIIAPISANDLIDSERLHGVTELYQLGIPKGDTHVWEGNTVTFWGRVWQVLGKPVEGIEDMIPLRWNRKVTVARYE